MAKEDHSEIRLMGLWKRYGWVFSATLFITLVTFTLFMAQGYVATDLGQGILQAKGSVHLKETVNANIFVNGSRAGRSGDVIDLNPNNSPFEVEMSKEERQDWTKQIKVKAGLVSIFYPILYPERMDFSDEIITANQVSSSNDKSFFFYTRVENDKMILYRYLAASQLFLTVTNIRIGDITEYITMSPNVLTTSWNDYRIIAGNTGRYALITTSTEIFIVSENGKVQKVEGINVFDQNKYIWSPNDSNLLIQSQNNIYSINPETLTNTNIHKGTNENTVDLQFGLSNSIVYLIKKPNSIDIIENSYSGSTVKVLDIPNIDNLRVDNIKKVFPLYDKQNLLVIQAANNIYIYDISKSDLKKLNFFANEEVVYLSNEESIIVTINEEILNQFRFYDIEQNESKTYTLQKAPSTISPISVTGYNFSESLIFNYGKFVIFSDVDGGNEYRYNGNNELQVLLSVKKDTSVIYSVSEKQESDFDKSRIIFEKFTN